VARAARCRHSGWTIADACRGWHRRAYGRQAIAPRFIEGYARANRQKPSGVAAKESILRLHLVPELGSRTLDTISNEHVQRLKLHLHDKSPKTINNVLSVLNVLLQQAVE
jgi:hypothetical protein